MSREVNIRVSLICNWLRECACISNAPSAELCRQYAEFIYKTLIPKDIMNNDINDKILENIDSFKAAAFINKSFDNARRVVPAVFLLNQNFPEFHLVIFIFRLAGSRRMRLLYSTSTSNFKTSLPLINS